MKGVTRHRKEGQTVVCLQPAGLRCFHVLFTFALAAFISAYSPSAAAARQPATESKSGLPTLTTARQAHSLTGEQAARAYPVHVRGVVTYYDPSIGSHRAAMFVHDATGTIYVEAAEGLIGDLSPGTLVDVHGVSGAGEFGPILAHPQIKVIGHSVLPANPPRPSLTLMETGIFDSQWIEAEGVIRSFVEYEHNVALQLAMDGGTVTVVMVKEAGANYSSLVDARVRIHAQASPMFNHNLQMIGVRLMCPNISAITIVEAPPGDPFKQPAIPVDKLLRWDQINASFHLLHLHGIVTLQWPGSLLCIRDETHGICAQTAQDDHVAVGDDVDVVGFVAAEDGVPVLTNAMYRSRASGSPVAAERVTAEQALLGNHNSELIQIDGQLIGKDIGDSETNLLFASEKNVFTVSLPKDLAGEEADAWKIGSVLRVTGICSVQLDAQRSAIGEGMAVPKSFRILMRSPRDIVILRGPSWWTPAHALVILALVLAGTLLALAWVIMLRKHVMQQTILLRESEERFRHMALHDALTGLATRLLLDDRLTSAVEAARRHQTGLALLMVDIDKFKEINDTFGHQAGDEVLRVTAVRLLQAVRKSDTVARMGGDEFVVLLPGLKDPHMAEGIAAKIVKSLAEPVPYVGSEIPVSVSVGVGTSGVGGLAEEALLKCADDALYKAKAKGRNCFYVFTPSLKRSQTVSKA
jgi:diguanylate cyclase (GGDEF)-like protein